MSKNCYGNQYWLCEPGIIIHKLLDIQCRQLWVITNSKGTQSGSYAILCNLPPEINAKYQRKIPLRPLEGTTLKYTKHSFLLSKACPQRNQLNRAYLLVYCQGLSDLGGKIPNCSPLQPSCPCKEEWVGELRKTLVKFTVQGMGSVKTEIWS